ncbi:MAG: Nif11-like leader peptide family natural product precursor [Chlorobium sp.]|nr:MAG: Nif11-like leader peptide family natural product precursor [Chlorobium sp.]
MSIDQAKAFLKELNINSELKQKLLSCSTAEARMKCARESGFEFTAEEIDNARSELFDDELDTVSGGGSCCGHTCENDEDSCYDL